MKRRLTRDSFCVSQKKQHEVNTVGLRGLGVRGYRSGSETLEDF